MLLTAPLCNTPSKRYSKGDIEYLTGVNISVRELMGYTLHMKAWPCGHLTNPGGPILIYELLYCFFWSESFSYFNLQFAIIYLTKIL